MHFKDRLNSQHKKLDSYKSKINMNLVFHISEDGSEINSQHKCYNFFGRSFVTLLPGRYIKCDSICK